MAVVALGVVALLATAFVQSRAARPEREVVEADLPTSGQRAADDVASEGGEAAEPGSGPGPLSPPVRLVLDVAVAEVVVVPAPAGEPIRVEASFDASDYVLLSEKEGDATRGWTYRITFRPRGSESWALTKVKVGGVVPEARISVPRGVAVDLEASLRGGIVAFELGGLSLISADLEVDGGAVVVSFVEPLAAPMESFRLRGDKGSLDVTLLGNASPRQALVEHRLGVLDLDLRGAWSGESAVRVDATLSAGTLWLPSDVTVRGFDGGGLRRPAGVTTPGELGGQPPPVLVLDVPDPPRNLIVLE